jgi:hypothetical protein
LSGRVPTAWFSTAMKTGGSSRTAGREHPEIVSNLRGCVLAHEPERA